MTKPVAAVFALLALAVLAMLGARYKSDLVRAKRHAGGGIIAQTAAGPIEYGQKGSGMALLSIHGAGGGFDQGLANIDGFAGAGFHIIAPSRFGYLRTPVPRDFSPAAQADAHAALLAALNTPKAIVVGISAGARSALELALRHPERVSALILIVPGTYSPDSPVRVDQSRGSKFVFWLVNIGADFVWWAAEKISPSTLIRFVGVRPELVAAAPRPEQDRIKAIVESIEPLSARVRGIVIDSNPDLHPLPLERISAPTLIISAQDDLFNTAPAARFAAAAIPGARLKIFESGGHLLVGRQAEMRQILRDFLTRSHLLQPQSAGTQ